jgi:hypothetical protein
MMWQNDATYRLFTRAGLPVLLAVLAALLVASPFMCA